MTATRPLTDPTAEELRRFVAAARAPRVRTIREFAETEIVLPNGRYAGRRYRCDYQPYSAHWFAAIDSGRWRRFAAVGPTQSGKTLTCYVIPVLYHIFEMCETVVLGVPHLEMSKDKWREDILPVIERTRYRDLLPVSGGGSRGGTVSAIHFRHGPTIRFMTGGGGDKTVAGFTTRVLAVTEVDGLDQASVGSREADRLKQLEARTLAWGDEARIYLECTASIAEGRIWQEYTGGTESRLVIPCPHCRQYVLPERKELVGWQDAASSKQAATETRFHCPDCGESWQDDERAEANRSARLVHRGQSIDRRGRITGEPPETETLGFRWSAVHNLFWSSGFIGKKEWVAAREENEDNAERELLQFYWARPWTPPRFEVLPLSRDGILARMARGPQGVVPDQTQWLTVGVDVGKWWLHYLAIAWLTDGSGHVIDYGKSEVPSARMDVQPAIVSALQQLRDEHLERGWGIESGGVYTPDQVWIDSRYQQAPVFAFVRDSDRQTYRPMQGWGSGQQRAGTYHLPRTTNNTVHHIGDDYHFTWLPEFQVHRVDVSSDVWKTRATERLQLPLDREGLPATPGALTIYRTLPRQHLELVRHLTAEEPQEEFIPGRGLVKRWYAKSRTNHLFDCLYSAVAQAHFCGVRLLPESGESEPPATPPPARGTPIRSPDGRPFHVLGRQ